MKDLYREKTNKDVYADECCMQPSASYSDDYVYWLEAKLSRSNDGALRKELNAFCDHLNTYKGLEDCRFDFMLIDYLDKIQKDGIR